MLFLGSSLKYSPHINHSGQDSLTKIFFRVPILRSGLEARSNKNSNTNPVTTDCRPKYRLGTKCRLRICTVFSSDTRYVIRDHFTTYQTSRNRFSAIIFLYYLHYGGIFLSHFLITVVLNKVSSLRIVFSLCARIGWCDFCTEFTDLIKVDLDVMRCLYGIFNTRNFRKTINSFARSPYISSF